MSLFEILFGPNQPQARVKGKGICMFPLIRAGDEMVIEPRKLEEVQEGEIAAFLLAQEIAAHRVIGIGEQAGESCLFTKGDNNSGSGEVVLQKDLVGVVVWVERKGQVSVPRKQHLSPLQRFFNTAWLRWHQFWSSHLRHYLLTAWAGLRLFVFNCAYVRWKYREIPETIYTTFDMSSPVKLRWLKIIHQAAALREPAIVSRVFFGDWQVTFSYEGEVFGFFTFHRQKENRPEIAFLSHLFINPKYWRTPTAKLLLRKLDAFSRLAGIEVLYAAAQTLPGRRFLKDSGFVVSDENVNHLHAIFYEYLGPQSLPKHHRMNKARWILQYTVPDGDDREKDLLILGVE